MFAGTSVHLIISAQALTADDDIRSSPERSCLFRDERHSVLGKSLFQNYTHESCVYECLVGAAYKALDCAPWDVPFEFVSGETAICSGNQTVLFKLAMQENEKDCVASCPASCEEISYYQQVRSQNASVRVII